MNRLQAGPTLAAALALVVLAILMSVAPAAQTAPLAVLTTPLLDDFNRPDEDPLSGGGNWARTDLGIWSAMRIVSNKATRSASGTSDSYWTQATLDGDAAVVRAVRSCASGPCSVSRWALGLFRDVGGSNAVDGYRFSRVISGAADNDTYQLQKVTNGSFSNIPGLVFTPSGQENNPKMGWTHLMIRRNGDLVEGWHSPDGVNWELAVYGTDTTYTTGLRASIGLNGSSALNWDDFGGGAMGSPPSGPVGQARGTCSGRGLHAISASSCLSDPVNTLSGAFVTQVDDLATPGTGVSFDWSRSYTSEDPWSGPASVDTFD